MTTRWWLRGAIFATALVLLTLRNLHRVQPWPLALFLPLVLLSGALFERVWHTRKVISPLLESAT